MDKASVVYTEDALFAPAPLWRSFQMCTKQPLASALDHLQLVGETLNDKGEPHPFAEATLICTAITTASYSLWMLHDDATERRHRALQFNFKDCEGWGGFCRSDRHDPDATDDDRTRADDVITEARRRKDWIVDQANTLTGASHTFGQFKDSLPRDVEIIEEAAGIHVLTAWRFLSGYSHGLPWATLGNQVPASGTPQPDAQMVTVTQKGNPTQLLKAAFLTLEVIEKATAQFRKLCAA